jgi:hypothetical protein
VQSSYSSLYISSYSFFLISSYSSRTIFFLLHPLSLAAPFWATLYPSELRCTLLSYASAYWATLNPNWAMLQPKNYNLPPPRHRSFTVPSGENPIDIPVLEKIRECAGQLIILLYVPRPLPRPSELRWSFRQIIYRKNPAKYSSLAKNPPKFTTAFIVQ